MIAAGNVQEENELAQIFDIANRTIVYYLERIADSNFTHENTTDNQNYYCENQKQNPHTPKVMASLGLNEEDVQIFIQDCLFPEIR
jgi:hypothetical protein